MSKAWATPQELYGPLFIAVQERAILADGKTFVDAVPKRPVGEIMADFERLSVDDDTLAQFIAANFDLPPSPTESGVPSADRAVPLRDHIRALWSDLARAPSEGAIDSSALPVRHRHVVPGGRFREIYYWDSYFTMLGLVRDGETELANGIVNAMTDLIEDHGHIPNGARTYFLGRSQPPVYYMMVALLDDPRPKVMARHHAAMKREHAWWMAREHDTPPGASNLRVARLSDGSVLNRYWDARETPRDESWREDVATAAASGRPAANVCRDLRAGAESGWDFSSRWLDGPLLTSIRTTSIAPVDLNAFLFGLESAIAASGDHDAPRYKQLAHDRRAAIRKHLWDSKGFFADLDLGSEARRDPSAAALTPLLVGSATQAQADTTAQFFQENFLAPGGLRTTLVETSEQWDRPNGWAPLQWIAVAGLRRYGHGALAREIAQRWVATVDRTYRLTGLIYEKYNVETGSIGAGGEYGPQTGFGWTNGVTADFLDSGSTTIGVPE